MRRYATADEYEARAHEADAPVPDDLDTALLVASGLVDRLLIGRVYDVDRSGMPTDSEVAAVLAQATCLIVDELAESGALTVGGETEWDSVSIGKVSLSGRRDRAGAIVVDGVAIPLPAVVLLRGVGRPLVVVL